MKELDMIKNRIQNRRSVSKEAIIDIEEVEDNYEGHYEWKDVNFALDFNSKEIAGCSNLAQMIKEIYDIEDIKKFY